MGTRIEVYLSHDLPRFEDAAAVLSRLEPTMPAVLAVRDYWRSADLDGIDGEQWVVQPEVAFFPEMRRFEGPRALWLSVTPAAARINTGARWRGFLSIEPLRRVHLAAFRAIADALGSAEMAICADCEDDAADAFISGGTQADCVAPLGARLGPPQPSVEVIGPEVVSKAEHGVPAVWYLEGRPGWERPPPLTLPGVPAEGTGGLVRTVAVRTMRRRGGAA